MSLLEKLAFYWNYPFVRYALIVGVLIALCSSLLGVTLVLKRFSFIGDGLSHVAFGGMAVATVLGMSDHMPLTLAVTVACAVLLLHTGQNTQIKGDAAIAMVSVGALAMGYLLMNLFSTSANLSGDVCSSLFGSTSILTLTKTEVWLCIGLSIIVVAVFMLFYNKIFAVTFDETFAKAVGTNANGYNLLIAIVIAVIIVLAMNLVGSLLISALVIFPALSAMRLCKNFRAVTICSAVLSVSCAFVGIVLLSWPERRLVRPLLRLTWQRLACAVWPENCWGGHHETTFEGLSAALCRRCIDRLRCKARSGIFRGDGLAGVCIF